MKKNKMMRIASVLLVAVLLSTCAISGTFAKYVSKSTGTATANVAKWDIRLNDGTSHMSESFTFDLFSTLLDDDGTSNEENVDTEAKVIAPGTAGSFTIRLENKSQVNANYTVEIQKPQDFPENITFNYTANGQLNMNNTATDIVVNWTWEFAEDVENTYAGQSYTVEALVTVTQVD